MKDVLINSLFGIIAFLTVGLIAALLHNYGGEFGQLFYYLSTHIVAFGCFGVGLYVIGSKLSKLILK